MACRLPLRLTAVSLAWLISVGCALAASPEMRAPLRSDGQEEVSLPFTTVAQGAAPGGEGARPFLRLVRTERQRAALAARLSSFDRPRLNAVDLSTNIVIAAFQGLRPTSGHRIDILAVGVSGDVLEITVKRSSPSPGEPVRQGFESPYHLIQVARPGFDAHNLATYRLGDTSGDVLEEGPIDSAVTW
jgi:hypothetical protein